MIKVLGKNILFLSLLLAASVAHAQFRIVGYLPTYRASYINSLQYDKLTHINYSFLIPDANGNIITAGFNTTNLSNLITKAHQHNVKVLMAFGGWNDGDDSGFRSFSSDATKRTNFVNQAVVFAKTHNLDGIDIDWEFPQVTDADNFLLLMKQLYDSLSIYNKLLTAAVVPSGAAMAGVKSEVFQYVDWLNIMAYDNYAATNHSSYSYASSSLTAWGMKGLSASKMVLGVPFYAIKPTTKTYAQIVGADPEAAYSDESNGSYYNGIPTIQEKTILAQANASGIMIWELSQDTFDETSLLTAIYEMSPLETGIFSKLSKSEAVVYPNPLKQGNKLTIKLPAIQNWFDQEQPVKIFDLQGIEQDIHVISQTTDLVEIEIISKMVKGLYVVKINGMEQTMLLSLVN